MERRLRILLQFRRGDRVTWREHPGQIYRVVQQRWTTTEGKGTPLVEYRILPAEGARPAAMAPDVPQAGIWATAAELRSVEP